MTTEEVQKTAQDALRLYRDSSPHIKERKTMQLLKAMAEALAEPMPSMGVFATNPSAGSLPPALQAPARPGILEIRQRIEAALMKVAENVAKHTIGRSGWHPDDSCFRVDLREAQAEIESLIPCLLAAPQDLCRARGCGHSVAYHDRATHQCGVAYCECEQFTGEPSVLN